MVMSTRIEQPQMKATGKSVPEIPPDVLPSEGVAPP
jgi:hypothetical protein